MSDKPELVGILFRPDGTCSYDGGKTWHDWTQGPGKPTVTFIDGVDD